MSTVNGLKDFFVLAIICSYSPFIALKVFVKTVPVKTAIALFYKGPV